MIEQIKQRWEKAPWWQRILWIVLFPVVLLLLGFFALQTLRKSPQERIEEIDHDAMVRQIQEEKKRNSQLSEVEKERAEVHRLADEEAQRRIAENKKLHRTATNEQLLEAIRNEMKRR